MGTTNTKTRGECGYCGASPMLRKDGSLYLHQARDTYGHLVPCHGSRRTPEETAERCTARDATGEPVDAGARVMLGDGYGAPVGIVRTINWDHPNDADRGVAWLDIVQVRDLPEGGSVAIRTVERRASLTYPESYNGHSAASLREWAEELTRDGYPVATGLRGYALLTACEAANDDRRRAREISNLAPLGGAPMMPGVRLAMACGCLIEATSPLLSDAGPNGAYRTDPALYVEGVYVALCGTRTCGHGPSVEHMNDRRGYPNGRAPRFYLHHVMVMAPAPVTGDAPAALWQAYASIVETAGCDSATLVHVRSAITEAILADPETIVPGAGTPMSATYAGPDTVGTLGRDVVLAWREFDDAIRRGAPDCVLGVHRRRIARRLIRFVRFPRVSPAGN